MKHESLDRPLTGGSRQGRAVAEGALMHVPIAPAVKGDSPK